MVKPFLPLIFLFLSGWTDSALANCNKIGYGAREVSGLIQITKLNEAVESKYDVYEIVVPSKSGLMELVWISIIKGCAEGNEEYINIPLKTHLEDSQMKTEVALRTGVPNEWFVWASYLPPSEEGSVIFDGPSIESLVKLKHNKSRNVMDGSVEPPIR